MSSLSRAASAVVIFVLMLSTSILTARAQQRPLTSEQTQVVDTVRTIFVAARADDVAKFDSIIAPDFYIYDGGARF